MDARQQQYLAAMGITAWQRRELEPYQEPGLSDIAGPDAAMPVADSAVLSAADVKTKPEPVAAESMVVEAKTAVVVPIQAAGDWDALQQQVDACQQCNLYKTRMNAVFGGGDRRAQWMIIGDAPGADDDKSKQAFAGEAGLLLNAMLQAVGLKREAVFLSNSLKCRPPNNRSPKPEELSACSGYLQAQIELLQPKLIISLGASPAQTLLHRGQNLGELRGKVHHYGEQQIPLVVSHPPAHLLRVPADKRDSWADLQLAMSISPGIVAD